VREPAAIPTEGRRLPIEDALPFLEPRDLLGGAAPEALGVARGLALPVHHALARVRGGHPIRSAAQARVHAGVRSRSLNRWIFPAAFFGSSGTNSIQRGYLYGVIRPFTNALSSSASSALGVRSFLSSTNARGFTRSSLSFAPTTPHSSTAGCSMSAASTSAGETHCPETFSMSSERPSYV